MAVVLNILSEFDGKGISKAKKEFGQLETAAQKAQFAIKKATVPAIAALGAVATVAMSVTKSAIDFGETLNAVFVTFGKQGSEEIAKLAETSAKTYGLSKKDFNNMAVSFANFAQDLATPKKKATAIVADLAQRVADFASVMNLEVPDAAAKFASALAGESEPMKKFGINISDAAIKTFALENNIGKAGEKLTESQKATARYGLLMQKTAKFSGDFANTSDSLANKQKVLNARFADFKVSLGQKLIPIFEKLMPYLEKFIGWVEKNPKLVIALAIAIGVLSAAITIMNIAMAFNPVGLVIVAIAGLIAGLVVAYKKFEGFRKIVDTLFGAVKWWITNVTIPTIKIMVEAFKAAFNLIAKQWNATVGGFEVKIPSWFKYLGGALSLVAGKSFTIPQMPTLGDDAPARAGGGGAGHNGPLAIIPANTSANSGMNITVQTGVGDPVAIGKAVSDVLVAYNRRTGVKAA